MKTSRRSRPRAQLLAVASVAALGTAVALLPAAHGASPGAQRTLGSAASKGYVGEFADGHVAFVVSGDGRQVTRAFIGYRYACSDNDPFSDFESFQRLPMSATGAFTSSYDSGKLPSQLNPGGTFQYTGTISGKRNKAKTKIVGTARFTYQITSPAGEVITCDTGLLRFTAKD